MPQIDESAYEFARAMSRRYGRAVYISAESRVSWAPIPNLAVVITEGEEEFHVLIEEREPARPVSAALEIVHVGSWN